MRAPGNGFTLVELIIVIAVVVLILAIAVPGLSAMNAEARLTGAAQTLSGGLTRAYYLAVGDLNMTAVRFVPGPWDANAADGTTGQSGRQHLAIYRYAGTTYDPQNPSAIRVVYDEHFTRREGVDSVRLPPDVWVAPAEALSQRWTTLAGVTYGNFGADFVLDGRIGQFAYNAARDGYSDGGDFLSADDFLIVIDPKAGVQAAVPRPYVLRAFSPLAGYEVSRDPQGGYPFQRYGFGGVVVYRREPLAGLGVDAAGADRQALLRQQGRPYMVHRFSGGLVAAAQRPQ